MKKPSISLIMINYNRAEYIEDAINSILLQSNPCWELILIDDGSIDNSISKIRPFLRDERIKFHDNKKNMGIIYSRKLGIEIAQSEIIGTIDSDDCLEPDAVQTILNAYKHNDNELIYSQLIKCDKDLKPLYLGKNAPIKNNENNLIKNCISHFLTFKKTAYKKTSGYNHAPAEDKDIIYKLEEITNPLFIDKVLYKYRINPSSVSNFGIKKINAHIQHFLAKYDAYNRRRTYNSPKKVKIRKIFPWIN